MSLVGFWTLLHMAPSQPIGKIYIALLIDTPTKRKIYRYTAAKFAFLLSRFTPWKINDWNLQIITQKREENDLFSKKKNSRELWNPAVKRIRGVKKKNTRFFFAVHILD